MCVKDLTQTLTSNLQVKFSYRFSNIPFSIKNKNKTQISTEMI